VLRDGLNGHESGQFWQSLELARWDAVAGNVSSARGFVLFPSGLTMLIGRRPSIQFQYFTEKNFLLEKKISV
jgi:hypothetical protein